MTTEPTTTPKPRRRWLQFSLRTLLVVTAGVNVLFGLIAAGWYTSAFWFLAASGTCMMAVDVVLGRVHRLWAAGLLLIGIGYAVANFGVFTVTMSLDAFGP